MEEQEIIEEIESVDDLDVQTNNDDLQNFVDDHEPLMDSVSYYYTDDYTIELVHQITLGDILITTVVSILIIVVLLSRLLGGRR